MLDEGAGVFEAELIVSPGSKRQSVPNIVGKSGSFNCQMLVHGYHRFLAFCGFNDKSVLSEGKASTEMVFVA